MSRFAIILFILLDYYTYMLVGHRRVAGSNKSSHYDHRLILCAVGAVLVRLDIYKSCREEPKHRDNNVYSKTLTYWYMYPGRAEAQKRFRALRQLSERFGTQSRFGERRSGLKRKIMICHNKTCFVGF